MRARNPSPLRYPGGKGVLADTLICILYANQSQGGLFVEPFAGGAGAALKLLFEGHVGRVIINDKDPAISSFWRGVIDNTPNLSARIRTARLTISEWRRQRATYRLGKQSNPDDLGFAAFFLNRSNRSGIVKNGGPIGGIHQSGKWKISARFSRQDLADRVEAIGDFGNRITSFGLDAGALLSKLDLDSKSESSFVFADPPYFNKGGELYLNHFTPPDHARFASRIRSLVRTPWAVTYDDVPEIRLLYEGCQIFPYRLRYSAHKASSEGGEILILPPFVKMPSAAIDLLARLGKV